MATVPCANSQDVLTYHNDVARTGQNLNETILTLSNVNSASFGKLFTISADGKVDAQPLYVTGVAVPGIGVRNLLIVATEHDSVYAFDADTGAPIWHVSALKSGETPSDIRSCGQVTPEIGITATPVIDRTRGPNGAVYLVAMSLDGLGRHYQRLHALDLTNGAELFGGPQDIQATYPGTGDNSSGGVVTFDPRQYKTRVGLLMLNGTVYMAWGSHCDIRPYTGWVMGYDASTLAQTTVLNVVPNGAGGGIWMSQAGLAADNSGHIYLLDGNGDFGTTLNAGGFPVNGNYGNAFLKLSTSGGLAVADYFEMKNEVQENVGDVDLGSGGALVLPDLTDSLGHVWRLAVGAGKDTNLYLVNRDSMGKFSSTSNNVHQQVAGGLPGGVWGMPAYFNNQIYYGSVGYPIYAFELSNANLSNAPISQTGNSFGYPGTTPSISANGNNAGIVWATENTSPAVLHAYDATNLHELYNSNQASGGRDQFGVGNKFITPTITNGKVYVATTAGVGVFGLLPTAGLLTPTSGSGTTQIFSAQFINPSGAAAFSSAVVLINSILNAPGSCYVDYLPANNGLFLLNDAATGLLGPITPGSAATLTNSQCTLNASGSSATIVGNTLTLNASVTFKPAFAGAKTVFIFAFTATASTGFQTGGTWNVTAGITAGPLIPASGTGASQVFSAQYTNPGGAAAFTSAYMLINSGFNAVGSCYVQYLPASNGLFLLNDAATGFFGPITPGSAATLTNGQCTLNASGSSATIVGNTLTLNASLTFKPAFAGAKTVFIFAFTATANTGFQTGGTWSVTAGITAGPLSPSSGTGTSQVFSAQYTNLGGAAAFTSAYMLINSGFNAVGSCYVGYVPSVNGLYLVNDSATGLLGPVTPGSVATLTNSQCTLNASGSSATIVGNTLRLNASLTFKPAFAGAKTVFIFAFTATANTGFQTGGTWTAQ